jgi:hypothetical protein
MNDGEIEELAKVLAATLEAIAKLREQAAATEHAPAGAPLRDRSA